MKTQAVILLSLFGTLPQETVHFLDSLHLWNVFALGESNSVRPNKILYPLLLTLIKSGTKPPTDSWTFGEN